MMKFIGRFSVFFRNTALSISFHYIFLPEARRLDEGFVIYEAGLNHGDIRAGWRTPGSGPS